MRTQITLRLDNELVERVRNIIAASQVGDGVTITRVLEDSLFSWADEMEKKMNKGKPLPPRTREISRSTLGMRRKTASK